MDTFFYPTLWCGAVRSIMPVRQYLLPASSWGRFIRKDGTIRPANLPSSITRCAVDPGAYEAARRGRYQYDFNQYLHWLFSFAKGQIEWAGMPDYCCAFCQNHPPLEEERRAWFFQMADGDPVRARQLRTTCTAQMIWLRHRDVPFIWVPTLHGLTVNEYARHARDMRELIMTMRWWYGHASPFRVGIGSLCRPLPPGELHAIIEAAAYELPGVDFHLWGLKLRTFQTMRYNLPACVRSCDSTLWSGLRTLIPNPTLSNNRSGVVEVADTKAPFGVVPPQVDPFVKAWKLSGKSEMDYAYTKGLPRYEEAINQAFSKIRPSLLSSLIVGPPGYPQWDDVPEELNHLIAEARRTLIEETPYPEGYQWHFEQPNANGWFWP